MHLQYRMTVAYLFHQQCSPSLVTTSDEPIAYITFSTSYLWAVPYSPESGLLPMTREMETSQAKFQHVITQLCFKESFRHIWQVKYINEH